MKVSSGYTGISYPFRISNRGGCVTSTTSSVEVPHIEESIQQILLTNPLERVMESSIYSSLEDNMFEPNDVALQELLKSEIVDTLQRLEDRISVSESDVEITVDVSDNGVETIYALITYTVVKYNTTYTSKIKVGEINE